MGNKEGQILNPVELIEFKVPGYLGRDFSQMSDDFREMVKIVQDKFAAWEKLRSTECDSVGEMLTNGVEVDIISREIWNQVCLLIEFEERRTVEESKD